MLEKGFIQIYTGNGKGKTTAAIGQAVRAAGFGLKSYIAMFMKEFPYNEIISLKRFEDLIKVEQFANDDFIFTKEKPNEENLQKAKLGLETSYKNMMSGDFDIIILDESLVSIYFGLISKDELLPFLKNKPDHVELILTGRYCPIEFYELADLVTKMKEEKHYYQKGVLARKGIES